MKMLVLAAVAATAAVGDARADAPDTTDTTVVTGIRLAADLASLPEVVTVIDRQEILASAAPSLADLLRGRAGLEVVDFYGDGSRVSVGLRGFGDNAAANTLLLLDGRPLNNPDIGAPDLGRLRLDDIERIEILQGGSAFYGDQAVGGVINIITRTSAPGASLNLELGSYARRQAQARVSAGTAAGSRGTLSARSLRSDNYRDHNRLERDSAGLELGHEDDTVTWSLNLDYSDEHLQTPGALLADEARADRRQSAADFAEDFSAARTLTVGGDLSWKFAPAWRLALGLGRRDTDGRFRLSFRGFVSDPATQRRTVDSLDLRLVRDFRLGGRAATALLGTDLRRADYALQSQFGGQHNRQTLNEAYLGASLPLTDTLQATLALRHSRAVDRIRDSGDFASLPDGQRIAHRREAGSLGLAWNPADGIKLHAGWDQVLRYPKVDEYFGSGFTPDTIGLEAQTGDAFELGARVVRGAAQISAQLFLLALRNEIAYDPAANDFGANVNLDRSRRRGLVLDARWALSRQLALALAYTRVDAELRSGSQRGRQLPLVAEHIGRIALDWNPDSAWRLRAEWLGNSGRVLAGDFDNSLEPLPGVGVVNLSLRHDRGPWSATARIANLLDRAYAEQGVDAAPPPDYRPQAAIFPMPERHALLSLEYRL